MNRIYTECVSNLNVQPKGTNINLHGDNGADSVGELISFGGLTTSGSPLSRYTKLLSDSNSGAFNTTLMAIPCLSNSNSLVIQIE